MSKQTKKTTVTKKKVVSKKKVVAKKKVAKKKVAATKKVVARKASTRKKAAPARTSVVGDRERYEMIQTHAYFLAEKRNFAPGNEYEDWLEAERFVDQMLSKS